MFLSESAKATLFDRIVAHLKEPANFQQISNTGCGYFKLHVWSSSRNDDVVVAIIDALNKHSIGSSNDKP